MCIACFRLHSRWQAAAVACCLAGSGPWHEHPRPYLPLHPTPWAPLHLPGARHGHTRSKESSAELALRPHRALPAKRPGPPRPSHPRPSHLPPRPSQLPSWASNMSFRVANGSMDIVWSKICRRGEEKGKVKFHQACSNGTNQKIFKTAIYYYTFQHHIAICNNR